MTSTSSLRKNIVAGFAGKSWTAVISLVFTPLYLRFLGIEAYGLIGFYASLLAILSVLDMGLSSTLSRELARLSAFPESAKEARDLVRTMEAIYWGMGILIAAGVIFSAPLITERWLQSKGIAPSTVRAAVTLMGVIFALEWPVAFYSGGLIGLQKQVRLNVIRAGAATVQSLGAVCILWLLSPTIQAFFAWQIFVCMLQTGLLLASLRSSLPVFPARPVFRKSILERHWKFAAGMTGISILTTVLTQMDKVVLSRLLSLEMFGYYMLAFNVANGLNLLAHPLFSAMFPKFSQLVAEGDEAQIKELYHNGCLFLSILLFPLAITASFYPKEILFLWIGNLNIVNNTHLLLSLLLTGTWLNIVMILPFTLQLSYGWTRLSFFMNLIAVVVLVPVLVLMVKRFDAAGAAFVWILLNAGYFTLEIPYMHSRLLKGEMRVWYAHDIGFPLITTLSIVALSRMIFPKNPSPLQTVAWLAMTVASSLFFSSILFSRSRNWLKQEFGKHFAMK